MRPDTSELPIIRAWYEFLVWMLPKINKFPRDHRFMLGNRIEDRILEIMELLIRARYSRDRLDLLTQANTELDVLLLFCRMKRRTTC